MHQPHGYSGKPLAAKLGLEPAHELLILHAPRNFRAMLDPLPQPLQLLKQSSKVRADVIILFARNETSLNAAFPAAVERLHTDGALWVAWPKKTGPLASDLSEDAVRDLALAAGLVDNKVCAIDESWSGLRLVHRVANRAAIDARRAATAAAPPATSRSRTRSKG